MPLARFLAARAGLLAVTLAIVSLLVFVGGQILPGDIGRTLLGPLADAGAVAALNHQLGADRPAAIQYLDWLRHAAQGDFGTSLAFRAPVAPFIGHALLRSAALAAMALLMVVPIGVGLGILAALRAGSRVDRIIVLASVSFATIPDFASALLLMIVFALWLQWFPIVGTVPDGAGFWAAAHALVLPALPLVFTFTGYIARMARAGTIEALRSDYTRTAVLKGLPDRIVLLRHVLPNALMPTITVVATQIGYLLGGLVVIESLFHIDGLGSLVLSAAKARDFPMLEAGVMTMAVVYAVSAAAGDLLHGLLDPRLRRPRPR